MRNQLAAILLSFASAWGGAAYAQTPAATTSPVPSQSDCIYPSYQSGAQISWFLNLSPQDDLMTAWCRLQTLRGEIKFNVLFPTTQATKTWETSFNGNLPAARIVDLVQSLMPMDPKVRSNENIEQFEKVLENVVQLQAKAAPDGTTLGFASNHPAANELVLWEPLIIRVKPILLSGQQFTMFVKLVPNMGFLSLALQGKATDVQLQGWKGRIPLGNFFSGDCSSYIPNCKPLPETVNFHTPWIVQGVELVATGETMTASALNIADQLLKTNASVVPSISPLKSFNSKTGQLTFNLTDNITALSFVADGSPSGTKKITIRYTAANGQYSITSALQKLGNEYRQAKKQEVEKLPNVPESLNRL
ncbi:hypothetical protein [Rhizobium sp. MHM7A]|uniref:hypothetical protein n=1 Tax=Rhizobium sp. MHM7A TaxID=2583233 RepID=UPI001106B752|nr:hypothetical protein [Rhizobium sp. MHM7A]TLX15846.1 hypothetical protein FFR93_00595 [Rhizobium sp. MHM7A]